MGATNRSNIQGNSKGGEMGLSRPPGALWVTEGTNEQQAEKSGESFQE